MLSLEEDAQAEMFHLDSVLDGYNSDDSDYDQQGYLGDASHVGQGTYARGVYAAHESTMCRPCVTA